MLPTTAPATVPPEGLLLPSPDELPLLGPPLPDEGDAAEPGAVHSGASLDPLPGEFDEEEEDESDELPAPGDAESGAVVEESDGEVIGSEGAAAEEDAAGEAAGVVWPEAFGLIGGTVTKEG